MPFKDGSYNDDGFWNQVDSESPTLLAFWNHNCAPCHVMAPIFERLGKRYRGRMEFIAVSVYDRPDIAKRFGVSSTPTLIITRRGKAMRHMYGVIHEAKVAEQLEAYALPPVEAEDLAESGFLSRLMGRFGKKDASGDSRLAP